MKLQKTISCLLLSLLVLSGCAPLNHLDELSMLGELAREKDNQDHLVKAINDHYDVLTKVIAQGHISDYKNESSFTHAFGDPISKRILDDGMTQWLYRYCLEQTAKDKVYIYFDAKGQFIKWEKIPCPSLF